MFDIKFLCGESTVLPMAVGALDAYNICKEYMGKCDKEQVEKHKYVRLRGEIKKIFPKLKERKRYCYGILHKFFN